MGLLTGPGPTVSGRQEPSGNVVRRQILGARGRVHQKLRRPLVGLAAHLNHPLGDVRGAREGVPTRQGQVRLQEVDDTPVKTVGQGPVM